jgi:hypothetical protein|nr:MAG TPA: hypothetical protein [Caudoviricetes sp.]
MNKKRPDRGVFLYGFWISEIVAVAVSPRTRQDSMKNMESQKPKNRLTLQRFLDFMRIKGIELLRY